MCISVTICLGILAGGAGSRLGGRDKGLLLHHGRTRSHWLIREFGGSVQQILINHRRNSAYYTHLCNQHADCDTVGDGVNNGGPIAGIIALLQACHTQWLAVIPVDIASVSLADLQAALTLANECGAGVFMTDQGQHTGTCLLDSAQADRVTAYWQSGGRSMRGLFETLQLLPLERAGSGDDIDTHSDLSRLDVISIDNVKAIRQELTDRD